MKQVVPPGSMLKIIVKRAIGSIIIVTTNFNPSQAIIEIISAFGTTNIMRINLLRILLVLRKAVVVIL